jgi:hypothetical protein
MAAGPRRKDRTGRTLAVGLSIAAHVAVAAALVWRLGLQPMPAEPPVMNVELAALPHHPPREKPRMPPREPPRRLASAPPVSRPAPLNPPPDAREANPAPEVLGAPPGIVPTLRALLGCDHARLLGLSAEERERCRDRQTAQAGTLRGQAPQRLNLDQRGDYVANPEAYLNRHAHNGCKVRAAGDVRRDGAEGARAGVECAVPF